jgi:carbon starvation protein
MGYMLERTVGIPTAIGAVLGILVVEGFVVTTLDTAVRLCRYMLEELWSLLSRGRPHAVLKNPVFNTSIAVGLMLFFASSSTIMSAWRIFGAGNQLIGSLAMTVATVWLLQRGRRVWFVAIPAVALAVTTFTMLVLFVIHNLGGESAGPMVVAANERGPLVVAAALMLILATGVLVISARRLVQALAQRRATPTT